MSMAWEPARMSILFFSPPAHLCAVIYITETSLNVALHGSNKLTHNSTQIGVCSLGS